MNEGRARCIGYPGASTRGNSSELDPVLRMVLTPQVRVTWRKVPAKLNSLCAEALCAVINWPRLSGTRTQEVRVFAQELSAVQSGPVVMVLLPSQTAGVSSIFQLHRHKILQEA